MKLIRKLLLRNLQQVAAQEPDMVLTTEARNVGKSFAVDQDDEEAAEILDCDVECVVSITEFEHIEDKKSKLKPQSEKLFKHSSHSKVRENRKLVMQMLKEHPNFSSVDVKRMLEEQYGIAVSQRTLQRRISEVRPVLHQSEQSESKTTDTLSAAAKQRRLDWAIAHKNWTARDWRNILNMDDTKCVDTASKEIYMDTLVGPEPAQCSDLNLLEQLMNILAPKLQTQAPQNVEQFRAALYDVWHSDQELVDQIEYLYSTMPLRVETVLLSGGAETDFSMHGFISIHKPS